MFVCALKNKGLEILTVYWERNDSDQSIFCCWITGLTFGMGVFMSSNFVRPLNNETNVIKDLQIISLRVIAVVRQQFVMGINCSIFLYRNSFGANQRLALTRKSFRITQVSHCAVQRVWQSVNVLQ